MARKLVLLILLLVVRSTLQNLLDDINVRLNDTEKGLSRKRRYLVFPEGSSLQLVFCFTMPVLGFGQIFTVGSTVALAWQLPHDPFVPFRKPSELLHRIDKPNKHTSGGGWKTKSTKSPPVFYTKTYYNPFLINKPPTVGYTTIKGISKLSARNPGFTTIIQAKKKNYERPVTTHLHPIYHKVYRRTRRDLYAKIERLFTGLSKDGRVCLFKAICEVSKAAIGEKGTFMEEIIKSIFRVRHYEDEGYDERDDYDLAANKSHNCTEMYPTCEHSIWHDMFSFS